MALKGYKQTEEHKRKRLDALIGRKHSKEAREKMSISRKGRTLSGEHKIKIGQALKGHFVSEETRRKKSKALKGRVSLMLGKSLSEKTRKKMSEARRGEKSHFWKGGITGTNFKIRGSIEFRLWREAVFARDNWTCQNCGAKSGNGKTVYLHAHHRKPFAKYHELRFAIDNGITLCKGCHRKIHKIKFHIFIG